jgi:ketosteroid isomerase-like protein
MSLENVEIVEEGWEAWFRGDLDALAERWDSEIVWDVTHFGDWPEQEIVGIDAIKRFALEWLEVWDDYEVGVDETLPAPDGRVISLAWQRAKGHQSGLEMDVKWTQIFTFRDGKITRIEHYDNAAEALEAAGLSE